MGQVMMHGVQKLLHLDTTYDNFPTWEESLEFEVDSVHVKAVATHMWHEEIVRVVEPFEVEESLHSRIPTTIDLPRRGHDRTQKIACGPRPDRT
jgi:hypothetical protein